MHLGLSLGLGLGFEVLPQDVTVVFLGEAADEFEDDDEDDDADAGAGHHAVGGDAPVVGDEAWGALVGYSGMWDAGEREERTCVDGIPVPGHLIW